ncbi:MAG: hypothetical protein GC179_25810 [Anaerolineaceae bacterium]|nr:hypothetical protein [Anaerolineaceae bacterium]
MEIKGKVIATTNYRSLPLIAPETFAGQQKANTNVSVNGVTNALDDHGTEHLWYRCALADGNFWIRSDLISFSIPSILDQLPFVTAAEIPNPKKIAFTVVEPSQDTLLKQVGVALAAGETLDAEEIKLIIAALKRYGTRLRKEWTAANLREAISILDKLFSYGVVMHGSDGGGWSLSEMQLVQRSIDLVASGTARHFQRLFNVADNMDTVGFRLMFAPLRIVRVPIDDVNPNPVIDPKTGKSPKWWARNSRGFELYLGNLAFTGMSFKFRPEDLIVHETSHCLNFRYRPQGKFLYDFYTLKGSYTIPAAETFDGKSVKTNFLDFDDGYSTRPRSSDHPAEVVTDAFTNDFVNGYQDSVKGEARRSQVRGLMKLAIENRLKEYGAVRARVRGESDKTLEGRLAILLDFLDETEFADLNLFSDKIMA